MLEQRAANERSLRPRHDGRHDADARTKIVATLGPATDSLDVLEESSAAAPTCCASIFRTARRTITASACARAHGGGAVGKHVALLGDLQGPKIRIERFAPATRC
jgi:pyruvate kinase